MGKCRYCEHDDNGFTTLNDATSLYSGIEIALNRQGILRVRAYDDIWDVNFNSQDMLNVSFCPICGRRFRP